MTNYLFLDIDGVHYALSPVADLVEGTTYADLAEGRERWALGKRIVTVAVLSGGETMENALSMGHLVTIPGQDETNA